MYVDVIANRGSPPAVLLRESYRENGKVKKRTLSNLSAWAPERVDALKAALRGDAVARSAVMEIVRSRPQGTLSPCWARR